MNDRLRMKLYSHHGGMFVEYWTTSVPHAYYDKHVQTVRVTIRTIGLSIDRFRWFDYRSVQYDFLRGVILTIFKLSFSKLVVTHYKYVTL